jgi:hypothetical protein
LAVDEQLDFNPDFLTEFLNANKLCVYEGLIKRHIGEIMIYLSKLREAEQWLENAAETHKKNKMKFHLAGDYAVRSAACKLGSNFMAARKYLNRAINIFKNCGANGWVKKYEKELTEL